MTFRRVLGLCAASMAILGLATAHGGGHQKPIEVDPKADWATRHMAGTYLSGHFLHRINANG
jgi:hypothetical protein